MLFGRRAMLRRGVLALGVAAGLWIAGLFWFVAKVPHAGPVASGRTDAIVVLTGGSERLDTGLRLLAEGAAGKVFVSGVARGVDMATLLRVARRRPEELACCVAIGYQADNTAGNARETAAWMRKQGYTTLRLVTAGYHMPRSLLEFRRAMTKMVIVPHPVFPPQFKRSQWWLWPGTASLLISEYSKYLLALLMSGKGGGMAEPAS
jgi:uncharacterized SAM-binding protein YcdF (DUF218 family)